MELEMPNLIPTKARHSPWNASRPCGFTICSRFALGLLFLSGSALLSGCNRSNLPRTVKAEGIITLDGTPVANATISFISEKYTYHATGNTNDQGRFAMRAFQEKPGAVPGDYKVEILKSVVGSTTTSANDDAAVVNLRNDLPMKYSSIVTSGLTVTVPDKDTDQLKFELTSK